METFFYPSRFYGSEPSVFSRNNGDWIMDMDPWYGSRMHSPLVYRRPRHPVATRREWEDSRFPSRLWGDVFTPRRRSRATSLRLPLQQLFDDDLFRSALNNDVICLLEHHSQKLGEADRKTENTSQGETKDATPSVKSTSSGNTTPDAGEVDSTKPSTSSAEPSNDSSCCGDDAKKEKKQKDLCDGYILHFVRSPLGFYRPVYSPITLRREQQAAPFKQLLDDDFFKSSFTDDLLSLLDHHVTGVDDANRTKSGNKSTENATSSGGAVATKEDIGKTGKPFNVALKLGDFQPENVNVSLDGRKVIVKAKREEQGYDDSWKHQSHVEYSFTLPEDTPAESLTSSFNKDGILSIVAKKDDASNKPLEGPPEKESERKEGQKDGESVDEVIGESEDDKMN